MKITGIATGSIAEEAGIRAGDELLEMNGHRIADPIDYRFHEEDQTVSLRLSRGGEVVIFDIEKDAGERLGIELEDMKILSCGNDCIFCFVDQNPAGLRKDLYFRDGDYRLSFMYGNYTTMTNAGPAILRRIIEQHLSPQYISVHVTDPLIRRRLMGLRKDDHILEKIKLLHDNGIDLHTQIVLCPGINDGDVLRRTVHDLYAFHRRIISLAVVPVGLTDHRFGLAGLSKIGKEYAASLIDTVEGWRRVFRKETGRGFVYPSDEFFLVAGRQVPGPKYYDTFAQIENGVGLTRNFLMQFNRQAVRFPAHLAKTKRVTLVTGELAEPIMRGAVLPRLRRIGRLEVRLEVLPNVLFGRSVTVAGLLSGKCLYSGLKSLDCGDLLLLPPDIVNADGVLLDDVTLPQLEQRLNVPTLVFDGRWAHVFAALAQGERKPPTTELLPVRISSCS